MSTLASYPTLLTSVAGVSLRDIADRFDTPVYVYDAAKIVERLADLRRFDFVRYAQKACSNLAILDLVRRRGALVDSVSAGEVHRALAAGFAPQGDPPPIVYTADIFDHDALDVVAQHGIHVNCGSPDMLDQLAQRTGGQHVTLRINPGFGHGHSQKVNTGGEHSKHGVWHEQLGDCLSRARRLGHTVTGLHVHIGSGGDMQHLAQVCGAVEKLARQVGRSLTSISTGGGLPVPYQSGEAYPDLETYYELWHATRLRLEQEFGHPVQLEIEPGRYIAAESGYLVTEIRAVKTMGENRFYLTDAGFNTLARPVMYGSFHPMAIVPADGATDRPRREVVVGGPLCESGDIFTQEEGGFVRRRELPEAHVGELLAIQCAGAYGNVMASNYNSKPLPAEVLIQDGEAKLVRRRQSFEDMLRAERIAETAGC